MNALIKWSLLQIKCAYCGKTLSQDAEMRFKEISLCSDCFYNIIGAHAKAHSTASSKPLSVVDSTAHSKSKSSTFNNRHFLFESDSLSIVDSIVDSTVDPQHNPKQILWGFLSKFLRKVRK